MYTTILIRKLEGKRSHGRPSHKWDNIKTDLKEIGRRGVNWIHLSQDRDRWRAFVNTEMYIRIP
jgi:hypothetical protein